MIVIPARMASTRFPGKPLVDLLGKPMVQWVYEAALAASCAESVAVATPDPEIVAAVQGFGGNAILTRLDHPSGTDRLAEVAQTHVYDGYINVQGDEPLIRPSAIRAVGEALASGDSLASAYCPCPEEEYDQPSAVKVVLSADQRAIYFSRYAVPFERNPRLEPVWKHIGLYAYSRKALLAFTELSPGTLEQTESLEQLRFLENGYTIKMVRVEPSETAIDTPDQADEVRAILNARTNP